MTYSLTQKFLKEVLVLFFILFLFVKKNKFLELTLSQTTEWMRGWSSFVTQVRKEAFKREEGGPLSANEDTDQ